MSEIRIKKLHKDAEIPKRSTELSGGWDLTCVSIERSANDVFVCHTGLAMSPPKDKKITIVPRSSLTKYRFILQNSPALGDPDYTGEYIIKFRALAYTVNLDKWGKPKISYEKFPYSIGERIAQMYLEEIIPIQFTEVSELDETVRGDGGFGSTGK